jgi:tetratricopeptide (TPR) repeat protein
VEAAHGPTRPRLVWQPLLDFEREPGPESEAAVARLVADEATPAIVRASALVRWSRRAADEVRLTRAIAALSRAADPLLRRAAAESSAMLPPLQRTRLLEPLWRDARRVVRLEAAMAYLDGGLRRAGDPAAFVAALREAREARLHDQDTLEGLLALGAIELRLGNVPAGLRALERAALRFPESETAYANWADALRAAGSDADAGGALARGIEAYPKSAALRYAQALWLVRSGRKAEAGSALEAAVRLADGAERETYRRTLELYRSGE